MTDVADGQAGIAAAYKKKRFSAIGKRGRIIFFIAKNSAGGEND